MIGAAAIESEFGSDLEIFTEVENCWRRKDIKGDAMPSAVEDCHVPSKIAKEVDDGRQRDSGRK